MHYPLEPTGTRSTRLVILRGNSASGKTSVAQAVREHLGRRCALVQQDVIRRTILKEPDCPGGHSSGLIELTARYALDCGYHVLLEGILNAERYRSMLDALAIHHRGCTYAYYLQVSFDESLQRHTTRAKAVEFGAEEMQRWYTHDDRLGWPDEILIPESSTLQDTTKQILNVLD